MTVAVRSRNSLTTFPSPLVAYVIKLHNQDIDTGTGKTQNISIPTKVPPAPYLDCYSPNLDFFPFFI